MRQREAGRLRAKLRPWSKEQTVEDHWSNRCSVMTLSFWAEHLYLIPLLIPFLSPKDHTSTSLSTRHLTSTLEKVSTLSPGDRLNVFLPRVSTLHFDSGVQGEKKELPIHLLITNCLSWLSVVRIKIPYQGKFDSWKTMQNSHPCSIRAECSVTSKSYTYSKLAVCFWTSRCYPRRKESNTSRDAKLGPCLLLIISVYRAVRSAHWALFST